MLQQAWETLQLDCELFHDPVKVLQPSHNLLSCIFFFKGAELLLPSSHRLYGGHVYEA